MLTVQATVARDGFQFAIDTHFGPGITCVLGPSGAGKSTLLGVIAGLIAPDTGRVALGDQVWVDTRAKLAVPIEARHVAYVFQSLALFPHLDAVSNVAYAVPRSVPRDQRRERAAALLTKLGVSHLAHRRPRTYSGGEAQRVALARAMAMAPRVMLLDEPFSALDHDLKQPLMTLVRDVVTELRVPAIAVTHSLGEARALADRVVRIAAGRVVADGAPADMLPARGDHDRPIVAGG
jgi:molybdate transport system ATP-binding protein